MKVLDGPPFRVRLHVVVRQTGLGLARVIYVLHLHTCTDSNKHVLTFTGVRECSEIRDVGGDNMEAHQIKVKLIIAMNTYTTHHH